MCIPLSAVKNIIFRFQQSTNRAVDIKTTLGSKEVLYQALVPAFPEFNNHHEINFILFDFHDYFDGVLGLKDLIAMDLISTSLTKN